MVVLSKIYTRTGDSGQTALGDSTRVPKHGARVAAYGTVDEANATLGLARLHTGDAGGMGGVGSAGGTGALRRTGSTGGTGAAGGIAHTGNAGGAADNTGTSGEAAAASMDARLAAIQNDLFDLGADLCRPQTEAEAHAARPPLRITSDQVARLEAEIDTMNAGLAPLRSFVLPGGGALAAHLHLSRTVVRRAERLSVALAAAEPVNPHALAYLNRLSDWLFVAARCANAGGAGDVLWVPGANRG